ncbi:MAG: isoprenylcysteine carboxylmethyltransferase family protein [Acidobacteria bacterium]|nr:isoprenylcysteine carboxylmethyltransferase family protein [Acidobacteriota bacterium]MCI0718006.1 isoprenylcysteine carboxylmethyltransferase family protein [Acidobacteriota bacterium]
MKTISSTLETGLQNQEASSTIVAGLSCLFTPDVWSAMNVALRSLLFTICVSGSATVWIPWLILATQAPVAAAVPWSLRLAGVLLVCAGAALYFSCLWDFTFTGRGTPAVWDPPVVFVSRGLYRFVRNPMYLAVVSILLGEALFFQSPPLGLMAAGTAAGFHLFVVFYEEPALKRKFGSSYEHYCAKVWRWLPRWPER